VKSLKMDAQLSWTSGNSLGMGICPLVSLMTAIPAVITTNTTASATDTAEVYFSESKSKGENVH
jgi:hypothetical protein